MTKFNKLITGTCKLVMLFAFLLPVQLYAVNLKIGYVDVVKVIEQAPQAKPAQERLDAEFEPRNKKLVGMREKIKTLEQELEKNTLVSRQSERQNKEKELFIIKRNVRRETQQFREDYNMRRNEELAAVQKVVYKTIIDIAKKRKFDLILHGGTIYTSDKIDITGVVLEKLRRKLQRSK